MLTVKASEDMLPELDKNLFLLGLTRSRLQTTGQHYLVFGVSYTQTEQHEIPQEKADSLLTETGRKQKFAFCDVCSEDPVVIINMNGECSYMYRSVCTPIPAGQSQFGSFETR